MRLKKTLVFIVLVVALFLVPCYNCGAYDSITSDLSFKLDKIIEFGDSKYISIEVTNNGTNMYSFGWVDTCALEVETSEGTFTKRISSGKIEGGTKVYSYFIEAPGKLQKLRYSDIKLLNSRGLPVTLGVGEDVSASVDVSILDFYTLDATPLIFVGIGALAVLITLIVILSHKKHFKAVKTFGIVVCVIGILTLIYSGISFVIKPELGQSDFGDVSKKYWLLWAAGMIVTVVGAALSIYGANSSKKVYSNYNRYVGNNSMNNNYYDNYEQDQILQEQMLQDQMLQEQTLRDQQDLINQLNQEQINLFQEQMLRDQEQAHRDMEQTQRIFNQTQRDLEQSQSSLNQNQSYLDQFQSNLDQINQQDYNDFNDFNSFNDFNDFNNF